MTRSAPSGSPIVLFVLLMLSSSPCTLRAQSVQGRLVRASGEPIVGAEVRLLESDRVTRPVWPSRTTSTGTPRYLAIGDPLQRTPDSVSNDDGLWRVDLAVLRERGADGVLSFARGDALLVFSADGMATMTRRLPEDGEDAGTDTLVPGATVSGRIVDTLGRPVTGAHVRLSIGDYSQATAALVARLGPCGDSAMYYGPLVALPGPHTAITEGEGRYRFENLVPGTYSPFVWHAGRAHSRWGELPFWAASPGTPLESEDIVLRPGRSVHVTVRDSDGRPVEGAVVIATDDPITSSGGCRRMEFEDDDDAILAELGQWGFAWCDDGRTDARGCCDLGGFEDVPITLYALADGYEPARSVREVGGALDVALTLQPWAELEVVVRNDDETAVSPDVTLEAVRIASTTPSRIDPEPGVEPVPWSTRLRNVPLWVDDHGGGVFRVTRCGRLGTGLSVSAPGRVTAHVASPGLQPGERRRIEITLVRE